MQSGLTSQYELAWQVADLVAMHGAYDFRAGDEGLHQVVKFCGLRVSLRHQMPVRIEGADLDITLEARPGTQAFETTFYGDPYRRAHALLGAEYTVTFHRGDADALKAWYEQITAFVAATAPRKAA